MYVVVGPLGGASRVADAWDAGFGGEGSLLRIRESSPLAAVGVALGGLSFSELEGGRIWADVTAATRTPVGLALGLSAGITAAVDDVRPPRVGAQAALWIFAGVVPYLRVGGVQQSGMFVDIGLKIALPALRFP